MSKDLTHRRKGFETNTITFPRELRDAIPDLPTCRGRVLALDSISGKVDDGLPSGRRVRLALKARETGKLRGEFTVLVDMDLEAARVLSETLARLAGPNLT